MDQTFGKWVKRRRKSLDLTQQELAQKVGCSLATIIKIEADERRPSRQIAELLAQVLDLPPDQHDLFLKIARQEKGNLHLDALPHLPSLISLPPEQPKINLPTPLTPLTYARTVGIPFIEDSTANFIYLGNPNSVSVPGDFNGWSSTAWPMTKLSQTNFWYGSENFELHARVDYKFVLNGSNWILDPENPNICQGGFGPNSELSMPLYVQPWGINYNPNIPHGTFSY